MVVQDHQTPACSFLLATNGNLSHISHRF